MSNVSEAAIRRQYRGRGAWSAVAVLLLLALPAARAQTGPLVEVRTELGTMVVRLFDATPVHRDHFLDLVRQGHYDGMLFHRVVPGLIVEGGAPASRSLAPGQPLPETPMDTLLAPEIVPGAIHRKGALAAMRAPDDVNPGRRSDGSRFYLVHGRTYPTDALERVMQRQARHGVTMHYTTDDRLDYEREGGAPHLDGAYTVFGQVVDGLTTLDAIAGSECDALDRPKKDVRMFMRVLE